MGCFVSLMERIRQGKRQFDISCPRCDFNQSTYCLAMKRGSVYLSTLLAFCESLGIRVALIGPDGEELEIKEE